MPPQFSDDEDWPDDVVWHADDDQGLPWAGEPEVPPGLGDVPAVPPGPPRRGGRWFGPVATMMTVIVVAAAAGAALTMALTGSPAQTPAAASSPRTPGLTTPDPIGGGATGGPGGSAGGEASEISMLGTVTAVTRASITIGGSGLSVTATVTSATRITGRVSGIDQVKVGDQVSAQMTQRGSQVTATTIQDPAEQPADGP